MFQRSGEFGNLLGSSIEDDLDSSTMNYGNENDENLLSLARVDDSLKDDVVPSGPFDFEQQRAVISKRSPFSFRSHSSKSLPQRRNNRPHWNPLIAAYKRCGDHADREYRETCFKNAIQMLFVYKL